MRILTLLAAAVLTVPSVAEVDDAVRLTESGAQNGQPVFSPDGSAIAFLSNRSGSWQVWVMAADGCNPVQVTRVTSPVGGPSWMPDNESLLFYARSHEGRFTIFRTTRRGDEPSVFIDDVYQDFRPNLSPDGRLLLFDRAGVPGSENHDIYVRDLESGATQRVTRDPGYDSDARWSPDGSRIVFHSDRGASEAYQTHIWTIAADGTGLKQLTTGSAKNAYPAWSPDGTKIAWVSEADGNRDVWIMNADGTNAIRVTRHGGDDAEPAWIPDGNGLVFPSDRFGGMELVRMSVEGLF